MIVEIGHFALALALGVAVIQTVVPLWGVARQDPVLASVGPAAAIACFLLVALAFGSLMFSYVASDFSVENVASKSHSAQPLIFKLTSVWGNHEGSMLLWVLILVLFGALVALSRRSLPARLRPRPCSRSTSRPLRSSPAAMKWRLAFWRRRTGWAFPCRGSYRSPASTTPILPRWCGRR